MSDQFESLYPENFNHNAKDYVDTVVPSTKELKARRTAKDGECFVEEDISQTAPDGTIQTITTYARKLQKYAEENNLKIILCTYCERPARHIDNLWPYHVEMNYCDDHEFAYKEERSIDWITFQEWCGHKYLNRCFYGEMPPFITNTEDCLHPRCSMENCPLWKALRKWDKNHRSESE